MHRSTLRSAAATATLLLAAACSDSPSTPASPRSTPGVPVPTEAAVTSDLGPFVGVIYVRLTVQISTGAGLPAQYAVVRFSKGHTLVKEVQDQLADDVDPRVGYIAVITERAEPTGAPPGRRYGVCGQGFVGGVHTYAAPTCRSITSDGTTLSLGTLTAVERPTLRVLIKDQFDNLLPGARVVFTGPDDFGNVVLDNEPVIDMDALVGGQIRIRLFRPGVYTYCESQPPTGFPPSPGPKCGQVTADYYGHYTATLVYTTP
jgi:hypothetical protein